MKTSFLNWWVVTVCLALIVAIILVWPIPIFVSFLRPLWVRVLMVLLVSVVWGGFAAFRLLQARKASEALAEEITKPDAADAEGAELRQRLTEALAALKSEHGRRGDYLYSRPWYVIIGPPGAGKTTALLNSGLQFPVSRTAMKGVGGTRNLDFWFSDQAVLVDTAGRFTTQDSDAAVDSRGWESFLGALRRNRPLRPINGVLVAIGLDLLLKGDQAAIDAASAVVRARLSELRQTLEINAPVYVLFTKSDLLAGFIEFWDDLDAEARRAVLGVTLPLGAAIEPAAMASAFDGVLQSVSDRVARRLQDEPDARRRGLIIGFPEQVFALRARALRFLEGAFPSGAKGADLRGFYFTSGVQEGAPLDRLLSGVAQVFDQIVKPSLAQGRAYFLNRLLTEVVFAEAGLVSEDAKARARRRMQLFGGLGAIGAFAVLIVVVWAFGLFAVRAYQDQLQAGANSARDQARASVIDLQEVRESDPDLESSLSYLNTLRNLPGGYAARHAGKGPLLGWLGLYPYGHAETAVQTYQEALQRVMLPRLLLRLEKVMQAKVADPMATYDALKVYLMLGGQGPMDAKAAKSWIVNDWQTDSLPGGDRSTERKQLEEHVDALLGDRELQSVWPNRQAPLDANLIASARITIQRLSLAERAFAILRQKATGMGEPWSAGAVLGEGDAPAFASGENVRQLTIPYFFTKEGYQKAYSLNLPLVQREVEDEKWVLGPDSDTDSLRTQSKLVKEGVAAAYTKFYIDAWRNLIAQLQPADLFHSASALATFTKTPSPLKVLLLSVVDNTSLANSAASNVDKAILGQMGKLPGANLVTGSSTGIDAAQQIQAAFKPLRDYVGDGKGPAPIDDFTAAIKTAGTSLASAGFAGATADNGQVASAQGGVAIAAGAAPEMLKGFVAKAARGGVAAGQAVVQGGLAESFKPIALSCASAITGRYPFSAGSPNDVTVTDATRIFGPSGEFDSFAKRILPELDTIGPKWRWKPDTDSVKGFDPISAERFQKASELRELMSSGVALTVELVGFGGTVTSAEFSWGGRPVKFDSASFAPKPLQWSLSGQLPEAHVTLFASDKEVKRIDGQGPWALFRLMDQAAQENAGPTAFKRVFGDDLNYVTLKFNLPSVRNPFSRGGAWSFRCPNSL